MAFHNNHKVKPDIFYRSSKTIQNLKDFNPKEKKEQQNSDQSEKKKEQDQ